VKDCVFSVPCVHKVCRHAMVTDKVPGKTVNTYVKTLKTICKNIGEVKLKNLRAIQTSYLALHFLASFSGFQLLNPNGGNVIHADLHTGNVMVNVCYQCDDTDAEDQVRRSVIYSYQKQAENDMMFDNWTKEDLTDDEGNKVTREKWDNEVFARSQVLNEEQEPEHQIQKFERKEIPIDAAEEVATAVKRAVDSAVTSVTLIDWGSAIHKETEQMQKTREALQELIPAAVVCQATEGAEKTGQFEKMKTAVKDLGIGSEEGHEDIAKLVFWGLIGSQYDDVKFNVSSVDNLDLSKEDAKLANALLLGSGLLREIDNLMAEEKNSDGEPVFSKNSRVFSVQKMWYPMMSTFTNWTKKDPEEAGPPPQAKPPTEASAAFAPSAAASEPQDPPYHQKQLHHPQLRCPQLRQVQQPQQLQDPPYHQMQQLHHPQHPLYFQVQQLRCPQLRLVQQPQQPQDPPYHQRQQLHHPQHSLCFQVQQLRCPQLRLVWQRHQRWRNKKKNSLRLQRRRKQNKSSCVLRVVSGIISPKNREGSDEVPKCCGLGMKQFGEIDEQFATAGRCQSDD